MCHSVCDSETSTELIQKSMFYFDIIESSKARLSSVFENYNLNTCWRTHKQVLLQTVKTQMKCRKMWNLIRVYTAYFRQNISLNKEIQYFLEIITCEP